MMSNELPRGDYWSARYFAVQAEQHESAWSQHL
ncbi:hypothetical protein J2X09_004936 [Hydrogenophaga laconesensis]|uniref:Uncharacterized protein n=1 Tax=Hydrogenophaga laconesensis TaxID=1805971 RepID=A0ABU1VIB2_9BURK|nr:hypothetical protein [Hydrogenophaga laconesensis]